MRLTEEIRGIEVRMFERPEPGMFGLRFATIVLAAVSGYIAGYVSVAWVWP